MSLQNAEKFSFLLCTKSYKEPRFSSRYIFEFSMDKLIKNEIFSKSLGVLFVSWFVFVIALNALRTFQKDEFLLWG